jgi:hypothetical protein
MIEITYNDNNKLILLNNYSAKSMILNDYFK